MKGRRDGGRAGPADRSFARHNPVGPEARVALVRRARGARLETEEGRSYLDFSCGGMLPLGHEHPEVRAWLAGPGPGLPTAPGFDWPERVTLRRKLAEIVPGGLNRRVRLCDSGREALAAAVGLACRLTGRGRVAWLAESTTGDLDRLSDAAALVAHPLDRRLEVAAERCRAQGALLVSDETRLAPGITGELTGLQGSPVRADLTLFGAGLACGLPLGAVVTGSSSLRWPEGDSGGVPAICRVALEYLARLESGLLEAAAVPAGRLRAALQPPGQALPIGVAELRGRGLVLVLGLAGPSAGRLAAGCRERGLLVSRAGDRALRIEPPLVATGDEIEQAGGIIRDLLAGTGA